MKLIDDVRAENVADLAKKFGGVRQLAEHLGKQESQVSQWINRSINSGTGKPRAMRSATAREIERKVGEKIGWLDIDRSSRPAPPASKVEAAADAIQNLLRATGLNELCLGDRNEIAAAPHPSRLPLYDIERTHVQGRRSIAQKF